MSQIINVPFAEGQREAIAAQPLEQWAYGQKLRFEGLDLPEVYQVDFSNFEFCGASIPRVGGADGVAVPVEVLTSGRNVYAFIWIQDETSGARYYRATVRVVPGPEPDTDESPEEKSAVTEAINALNDAAEAIPEQVNAALQEAKESGEFDGPAGSDGVSPTVQITTIEGGHRVTITDAGHLTGQSFDVMDGSAGGSGELYIVGYDQSASARPDVDEIVAAFDVGKAVLACATDADGGGHVLPLTAITRESGAVTALTFYAGGWSLHAGKIFAAWAWFLTKDEPPAEDLVLTFSASWNDDAEAYAVTTTATRDQVDEALAAGQRIEARLLVDNRQLLRQGTVYAERYSSRLNTVTIGFFGEAGEVWALTGTGGGWELGRTSIEPVELDTTLSQPGKAADAAAVGAALAAKGTYSKPSGGIPASDLAQGVIPTKISDLTNDSGYQTATQVEAAIDNHLSAVYKAAGTVASISALPAPSAAYLGYVYNVEAAFTTTADFAEGAGIDYPAGTDVAIIAVQSGGSTTYKYDALSGFVDLSGYQAKAITDAGGYYTTDTVEGALQEIGAELANSGGMTEAVKQALLDCFEHVVWIDDQGQTYYNALYNALYPPVGVDRITAVFNQGSAEILTTDDLNVLRQYLTVTAYYDDSSAEEVSAYTLSGELTAGTSTITVSYGGKTATFDVNVTEPSANVQRDGSTLYIIGASAIRNESTLVIS